MNFPWRPTLQEVLDHARRVRGIDPRPLEKVVSPLGEVRFDYVELSDPDRVIALSLGCELDDRLAPSVLANVCRLLGIPPDDFKLDPDPDD